MGERTCRISASAYSNTAPLIWSFLFGSRQGQAELVLDNAPARSAELIASGTIDVGLVPILAYQTIPDIRLVPDVCVGTRLAVRSVCLVTRGDEVEASRSVALDTSSRTSVGLTKILFREFLGSEPAWLPSAPDIDAMLDSADCALLIGDPALALTRHDQRGYRVFDLAEMWHKYTGLGFIFAMWMTRHTSCPLDLAGARDEGTQCLDEIAASYSARIGLPPAELSRYLAENIVYAPDDSMLRGMRLYFEMADKHGLIHQNREPVFTRPFK